MKKFVKLALIVTALTSSFAQANTFGTSKKIGYLSKLDEKSFAEQATRNEIAQASDIMSGVYSASRLNSKSGITIIDTIFSDKNKFSAIILGRNKIAATSLQIQLSGLDSSTISRIERSVQQNIWFSSTERVRSFGSQLTQTIYSKNMFTLQIPLTRGQILDEEQAKEVSNLINEITKMVLEGRVVLEEMNQKKIAEKKVKTKKS